MTNKPYKLICGDSLTVTATFEPNSIDAIVTDPPYGLSFMGKHWDHRVPGIAFWKEALRVLKPGGHLLAFGGTRTYHRLATALEDAGFEIRDQITWLYGSGFPKSRNIGNGYGTALKPANEPICLARKPLEKGLTVAQNVLKWGTGAINVDGCRVATQENLNGGAYTGERREISDTSWQTEDRSNGQGAGFRRGIGEFEQPKGRWPANVIHDGSDEVEAEFAKSGERKSCTTPSKADSQGTIFGGSRTQGNLPMDSGTASRFFYCAKSSKVDRNEGCEELQPKHIRRDDGQPYGTNTNTHRPDGSERKEVPPQGNHHPTVKPTELMRYLCRLITPPKGIILDMFAGSGSTGKGAVLEGFEFIGIELDPEYCEIAEKRIGMIFEKEPLFHKS